MKTTRFLTSCVLAGLLAYGTSANAQDLLLQVDRATGDLTLTGASATVVDLGGYQIKSSLSTLVSGNFDGLRNEPGFGSQWDLAVANSGELSELNGDGSLFTSINDTISYSLGTGVYDPTSALLAAGFGVDIEPGDLSIAYADPVINQVRSGVVEFTGEKIFNNIGITVDLADGTAIIENESPFNQTITGFLIEAATDDTLNTNSGTFSGVGGSFESPTTLDGENIGQIDPTGTGIALNAGSSINLGEIGGTVDDLSMTFILAGAGETPRAGFVKYLNVPTTDTEPDGDVDGADFLELQRSNPGSIPQWVIDYQAGQGAASAVAAVPEPTTSILLAIGCFGLASLHGRRR